MADIGFIGLGNMGGALARRLVHSHRLHVWDINPRAVEAMVAEGAVAANGPGGVAVADVVFVCLPTSSEVEDVVFGGDGLASTLSPEALVVDMTTGDPRMTREFADRLAERGISLVDAPVSGGVVGAERGTIAIMVGGPDDLYQRIRPFLETISPNVFHAGGTGAGHAMKLVNNMVSSCARIAVFEGLALAVKFGLEPGRFAEILAKGTGRGYVADTTLPDFVIPGRRDQGFGIALMYKDLQLVTKLAQDMKVPLTAGSQAREMFCRALNELGEDADITQLVRVIESAADIDVLCGAQDVSSE